MVLPETTEQVSRVLRYCDERDIKVVPRGAGTSLSGGALPLADGVLLALGKFNRILEVDYENRCVVVQPGRHQPGHHQGGGGQGFYYAPDPSSQIACTIGGNVAENSGGVHCLKYGLTTNNLLGLEMVLIDGDRAAHRRQASGFRGLRPARPDDRLRGLLGVVTEVTVRILKQAGDRPGPLLMAFAPAKRPANAWPRSSPPASSRAAWR